MVLLRYLTKGKSALPDKSTCPSLTRKEVDSANECVIICTELPPNLNPPIFLFRLLGTKPPNLKIANISGYTVVSYEQVNNGIVSYEHVNNGIVSYEHVNNSIVSYEHINNGIV